MPGVSAAAQLSVPGLWLTGLERGLMLAGLVVALGGLAGRSLARHYKGKLPGPLPRPWAVRGSLLGVAGSAALLVTALAGPGLAVQLASPPAPGLRSGGTAEIAAVEVALFALAAVLARLRRPGWAALMLSGVIVAEGIRSHPEGIVPVGGALLAFCHVTPAVLWAGLLAYALRTGIAWRHHPVAVRGVIRLYATAAAWLFVLVLVTGIISAVVLVPLGSVLTTAYGLFLVAKVLAVAAAAGFAVAGRRWLRRDPVPGAGPSQVTRLELAVLAIVLAITGILTVLTPPAKPISPAAGEPALVHAVPATRTGFRLDAHVVADVGVDEAWPIVG
jgi:copper transport protein